MSRKNFSLSTKNMVATSKSRNKVSVISCSTPEHETESPSRDSDSMCDSEAASPVPFLCTQDGTEGETDVVWNYYTPKAEQAATSRLKNSTPLSRKAKKSFKRTIIERPLPRRRNFRSTQKRSEVFQDLIELNKNLLKLSENSSDGKGSSEKQASGTEEDLFSNSSDCSPKSGLKTNSRCLRKNLLSSKFNKPECETALESDDSMNECLIKASQIVEDNILQPTAVPYRQSNINNFQDSMDSFLNNIQLDIPVVSRCTKTESPSLAALKNDSFDSFVGNLNDSVLERLTQMPIKNLTPVRQNQSINNNNSSGWVLQEMKLHESPSKNTSFGRHSSMPESPSVSVVNEAKPSTSGMKFGRFSSMPLDPDDSPIRCTPEEIRKKHLQAREKLLAKRNLPFTSKCTQNEQQNITAPKKPCFQPKLPSSTLPTIEQLNRKLSKNNNNDKSDESDLKKIIEKKRQEALMKLRRKKSR